MDTREFQNYRAGHEAIVDDTIAILPMRRMGDPVRDIGGAAVFLASDDSQYLTGEIVPCGWWRASFRAGFRTSPPRGGVLTMGRLAGKLAIVTGGTQGIGKGIVLRLASEGAGIVFCSRNSESSTAVLAEVEKRGAAAIYVRADVSIREQAEGVVREAVRRFGTVDILINNAQSDQLLQERLTISPTKILAICSRAA